MSATHHAESECESSPCCQSGRGFADGVGVDVVVPVALALALALALVAIELHEFIKRTKSGERERESCWPVIGATFGRANFVANSAE